MLHNRIDFLRKCQKLKDLGWNPELQSGDVLARAFADLGIEEYVLLPSNKLLSLYTGSVTNFDQTLTKHMFLIPDSEQLINFLVEKIDFKINYSDAWEFTFADKLFKAKDLKDLLIDVMVSLYE